MCIQMRNNTIRVCIDTCVNIYTSAVWCGVVRCCVVWCGVVYYKHIFIVYLGKIQIYAYYITEYIHLLLLLSCDA